MSAKVMVIDDSELVLSVVRSFLSSAGHNVVTRAMAVGTRAAVLRERPDVVLLDVNMPLLDGGEVCASIRQHEMMRDTRILLHSDQPEARLRKLAEECGADGYLCKTGDRDEFLRRFDALRRHDSESAAPRPVRRERYVLIACSVSSQNRLRQELICSWRTRYSDSGTAALQRVFSADPPEVLLLGTSLLDMHWDVIRSQALSRDSSYAERILLIREGQDHVPRGVPQWDASGPIEELGALLAKLQRSR